MNSRDIPLMYEDGSLLINSNIDKDGYISNSGIRLCVEFFKQCGAKIYYAIHNLKPYVIKITLDNKQEFTEIYFAEHSDFVMRHVTQHYHTIAEIKILKCNAWVLGREEDYNNLGSIRNNLRKEE